MAAKGELLWSGNVGWGLNEDSMEYLDVPPLPIGSEEQFLLSVRNGSGTVDLVANVGHMSKCVPFKRGERRALACTAANSGDTFTTAVPHKLVVGDRVKFTGTGGGVTANLYYYVITVTSAFVFQVSTAPGGSLQALNADAANVVDVVPTNEDEVTVTSTQDAAATFTCTDDHGLSIGDAIVFSGDGGGVTAGNVYYVIATSTTKVFQVSTTRGGSAFNVDADNETNTFHIVDEFFALTSFDIPKFSAGTTTAPVAGLVSKVITGFGHYGGRINFEKSAATAAAFFAYAEIRRA